MATPATLMAMMTIECCGRTFHQIHTPNCYTYVSATLLCSHLNGFIMRWAMPKRCSFAINTYTRRTQYVCGCWCLRLLFVSVCDSTDNNLVSVIPLLLLLLLLRMPVVVQKGVYDMSLIVKEATAATASAAAAAAANRNIII